jgi:hypothetical protein
MSNTCTKGLVETPYVPINTHSLDTTKQLETSVLPILYPTGCGHTRLFPAVGEGSTTSHGKHNIGL